MDGTPLREQRMHQRLEMWSPGEAEGWRARRNTVFIEYLLGANNTAFKNLTCFSHMVLTAAVLGRQYCPYFRTWYTGAQKGQEICLDKWTGPRLKTTGGQIQSHALPTGTVFTRLVKMGLSFLSQKIMVSVFTLLRKNLGAAKVFTWFSSPTPGNKNICSCSTFMCYAEDFIS